jgi:rhodanese-related sulfurtransferase
VDVLEARKRCKEFTFLDVREWYEWEAGTVEGALHIPIRLLAERVDEVPKEKPVVVVCQVGQRSALAAGYLNRLGYEAHNLEGGVEAWTAEGLPLVTRGGGAGKVVDGWAQRPDLH